MAQISFRIPDEKREQLEKIAAADRRSLSFVINDAIDCYLQSMIAYRESAEDASNAAE